MLKKTLLLVFTLIVITGMVFTGCSKTTSTTTTSSTKTTTASTPTSTVSSGPQIGGTLRLISSAEVNSFMVGEMYSPEDFFQRLPAIESLVRYDFEKQQPVPFLAEAAIEDPVAKTVTFKLRDGVLFHDGTVCDAKAVMWNLEQERDAPNTAPDFVDVSSMEIVDDHTIVVNFSKWDNSFLREMCWDSCVISPTAYEKEGLDSARVSPVGTGPFKLVTFQRDIKKVFKKFDNYWQKEKPYLDEIIINIIADPTVQMASLLNKENDILTGLNPNDAKNLKSNPDFAVVQANAAYGTVNFLAGDSANPDSPFSNLKVRQAVSYAIDRESLVDYVYYGFAEITNGINNPHCWTYNPKLVGYPYDPEKAKQLLTEAGYPNGFSTTIWTRSEKIARDMYTAVQSNLADVGIKVDLQLLEAGQYGQMLFGTGWTNGMLSGGTVGDPELGIVGRFFFSIAAGIGMTHSTIHPDEVENAIVNMMSATDLDKKKAYAYEFQSALIDQYCVITPLLTSSNIVAKSHKVHNDYVEAAWTFAEAWMDK